MMMRKMLLSGWGRQRWIETALVTTDDLPRISREASLSRGLGRAYGDAALPTAREAAPVMNTTLADRVLSFDRQTGVLRAEAGLSLGELTRLFIDQLWFSPVVPGTRFVTLGGMVAADIHGKNHHVKQTFGHHVRALAVRAGDGRVYECSRTQNSDLFLATIGGMGLTGHILEVELTMDRIPSRWIYEESERFDTLEGVFSALRAARDAWPMTVAWIDTSIGGAHAGRGIVETRGRKKPGKELNVSVPFDLPNGLINPFTIRLMNAFWYYKHGRRKRTHFVTPEQYFWPLDGIREWNRVFGRRGFFQYQCVMPSDLGAYQKLLALFRARRACSFVTVFKDTGAEGDGMLSFPKTGTTLAVDIPVRTIDDARETTRQFNELVLAHGGRIYLAKDSFTEGDEFRKMYPRLDEWQAVRRRYDPAGHIGSAMADRLFGA
jgi:FAD/FMN-containing dehydrogenase